MLSDVTLGICMNASKPVLLAYFSSTGNTARVAHDLAERLGADIENIQDRRHRAGMLGQFTAAFDAWREAPGRIGALRYNPADYAITVVGTPVWTAKMTPAIRAYLRETRSQIQSAAFFVTSGDTDIGRLLPSLESAAGRASVASAGFNGKELRDAVIYERKLSALVAQVTRAVQLSRQAA
ncbi:flavodoxin family protein [Peristeroidobacter agariperforans]|uniref:flavodoxin family protein n=1 Tax=Peristeroidobacter agariperforans TaxID=268404 RepID=UPI00101E0B51|nr:flavodoxin [Peristeroidobacter agariperforans]